MIIHCCDKMRENASFKCDTHVSPYDCPDQIIDYIEKFDEFWIIIHDWWKSIIKINHCPRCWKKLPESKRDRWFDELEEKGYDNPFNQSIPIEYQTNKRFQK